MCKICTSKVKNVEGFKESLARGFGLPRAAINIIFPIGSDHLEDSEIVRIIENAMRMSIDADRVERTGAQ
jgi:hypothetical protein